MNLEPAVFHCVSGVLSLSSGLYPVLFPLCQTSLALTDLYNDFTAIRNPVEVIFAALEVTYANPPRQRPPPLKTKSWQTLVVLSPSLPPC